MRNSDPGTAFRLAAAAETASSGPRPQTALMDLLVNSGVDASLRGHTSPVYSVAFSLDGHTLATASADTTALLWDLTELQRIRGDLVGEACRRAGGLTEDEWSRYVPDLQFQQVCP